jgi:competence protein ComEC
MRYNKSMVSLRKPFIAGIIMILFLCVVSFVLSTESGSDEGLLTVAYLDVGQGDATFIESPSGTQVLIDGGKNGLVLRGLSKAMGFFDRTIDMVLISHPDLDHIGGLIDVFQKYEVETVVMTENISDTSAYELLQEKIATEGAEIILARRGQKFELGSGERGMTTLRILFPDRDPTNLESNTSSIVAELRYGESEFIFSGDSPQSIEEYLVSIDARTLQTDVLKVGHHGSKTSTAEIFVEAVSPALAIISAGKDNSYGHPHAEVTDRLTSYSIPYKNTADLGSIVLVSDGKEIYFK